MVVRCSDNLRLLRFRRCEENLEEREQDFPDFPLDPGASEKLNRREVSGINIEIKQIFNAIVFTTPLQLVIFKQQGGTEGGREGLLLPKYFLPLVKGPTANPKFLSPGHGSQWKFFQEDATFYFPESTTNRL